MNDKIFCSQCGGELDRPVNRDFTFCKYCGNKVECAGHAPSAQTETPSVPTYADTNEPNLIITYTSTHPGVRLVTRIASTGQRNVFSNGQAMGFRLPKGRHIIVLKIGKHNHNREIFITDDNRPVRIDAGFSGRSFINIDQPLYTMPTNAPASAVGVNIQTNTQRSVPTSTPVFVTEPQPAQPLAPLSLASFLLSILVVLAPVGFIMGIIELSRGRTGKNRGFAKAGVALGAIFTTLILIYLLGR